MGYYMATYYRRYCGYMWITNGTSLGSLLFMYFSLMVLNPTPPSKYLISTLKTLAGFSTGSIL